MRGAFVITPAPVPRSGRVRCPSPRLFAASVEGSPTPRETRLSVPCGGHGVVEATGTQVLDEAIEAVRAERPEKAMVHLYTRSLVAPGEALGLLQGELAVSSRLADRDPERGLGKVEHLVGAGEHAGDVGADAEHVPADGLGVEHVIEGCRAPDLGRRAVHELSDLFHRLAGEEAVLGLGKVAKRDEGRSRPRGSKPRSPQPGAIVGRQVAHQRSTSPMTGSTEEMTAMASAIRPPLSKGGSVCRFTKLGPLICIR